MSKKLSASSSRTQPEELTFFVDRSLGTWLVPDALREAGARVEKHADHFAEDCPDQAWLMDVGARGWVVLALGLVFLAARR